MSDAPVLHRGIGAPAACRSCGGPIVFARSRATGKTMPFEADQMRGEWVLVNGEAIHEGAPPRGDTPGDPVPRYTSHFATCPQAGQWRRKK